MRDTPGFDADAEPDALAAPPAGGAGRARAAMDEAALWLARLDSGTADRTAFERWRAADPAHAVAFARVAAAWTALDDPAVVVTAPVPRRRAGLSRRAAILGLGGLAVAAAGAGVSGRVLARERVVTGVGERRTVRLDADARFEMNTDSRLSWRTRKAGPEVWLERGEVAVSVDPHGAGVVVHAADSAWRLGPGRYNLRLEGGRLELLALEGRAEGRGGVGAAKGQQLVVRESGAAMTRPAPAAAVDRAAAWTHGEIVFDDAPLSDAVREYNRYLERKLRIDDPAVARLRIGGRFTSADPSDFLSALQTVLPVRAHRTKDGVLLTRAE